MKISEVTIQQLKEYCRVDSTDEDMLFTSILAATKSYIKSYTGLTDVQIDTKLDLTIALYVLAADMYDNRQYSVDNTKVNVTTKSILDMHSINLL